MMIMENNAGRIGPLIREISKLESPDWANLTSYYKRVKVVCPSQEFSEHEMSRGTARWLSVSRGLWESVALGKETDLKIIMLMAPCVPSSVESYILSLFPGSGEELDLRRKRHLLVQIDDSSEKHLSEKFLEEGKTLTMLRSLIDLERARGKHIEPLACYQSSVSIKKIADILGLELGEVEPELLHIGGKYHGKLLFDRAGVNTPYSLNRLVFSKEDLTDYIAELCSLSPGQNKWIIKIDNGVGSGHGNALFDKRLCGSGNWPNLFEAIHFSDHLMTRDLFEGLMKKCGAIVEAYIEVGEDGRAYMPSSQCYIYRDMESGRIKKRILGTHDQILGGRLGQSYQGCIFPANNKYRSIVINFSNRILDELIKAGVVGHLSVDFICIERGDDLIVYALEINLRQTGTTHPCRTFNHLVEGRVLEDGRFVDNSGREKIYLATDDIIDKKYSGITVERLIEKLRQEDSINYNSVSQTGVVPHLWLSLGHGKIGGTFIADSIKEAQKLKSDFAAILDELSAVKPEVNSF